MTSSSSPMAPAYWRSSEAGGAARLVSKIGAPIVVSQMTRTALLLSFIKWGLGSAGLMSPSVTACRVLSRNSRTRNVHFPGFRTLMSLAQVP